MRLTANRERLLTACQAVRPQAGPAGCKLFAGATLIVSASGPDGSSRFSLTEADTTIAEPGYTFTPPDPLIHILKHSVGESVNLLTQPSRNRVVVNTDSGRFEFLTFDPATYPEPASHPAKVTTLTFPGKVFREGITRTAFAASRRAGVEGTWSTTGILFRVEGNTCSLFATNSYHLAVWSTQLTESPGRNQDVLVAAREVKQWADMTTDTVELRLWGSGIEFVAGEYECRCPLLTGRFPSAGFSKVLAQPRPRSITVSPVELANIIELSLVAADEDEHGITLRIEKGRLTAQSEDLDAGSARVELAVAYQGPHTEIRLDGRRLVEYLSAVKNEPSVQLSWGEPTQPLCVTAGASSRYLLMPLVSKESV